MPSRIDYLLFVAIFKANFDSSFSTPYEPKKKDMFQFYAWKKTHPDVTPQQFVEVAMLDWSNGRFKSTASLSIAGVCSQWSMLVAKNEHRKAKPQPTKEYKF